MISIERVKSWLRLHVPEIVIAISLLVGAAVYLLFLVGSILTSGPGIMRESGFHLYRDPESRGAVGFEWATIAEGRADSAYREREYSRAIELYEEAAARIEALIKAEEVFLSPDTKEIGQLSRNRGVLLVKLRLAQIGERLMLGRRNLVAPAAATTLPVRRAG